MNTTATKPAPSLCPVCGMNNSCTLADPRTVDQACWCFSQSIDPGVLEALPAELRNRACLCPRCAGVADSLQAKPLR
ncbi:cysteine-rich CWC family protein [Pseudomonas capsici]|uniref:cysteine-rich CWC family protein n=1 Tax=Pseudomonas capsici TaxID=2810614 RepID=UPI0021F18611|nr:cysteine-rich CWC family protein [Pseudomonas capsici]MCV4281305.1 cysteine-rich CWC family protein [Pseudomonas capsici]